MKGFFGKPVDNLYAEPLIARWIRNNVKDWKSAVVVSKNPGGSKRVTSMADVLKLNFGIITTDRRRSPLRGSMIFDVANSTTPIAIGVNGGMNGDHHEIEPEQGPGERKDEEESPPQQAQPEGDTRQTPERRPRNLRLGEISPRLTTQMSSRARLGRTLPGGSPLQRPLRATSESPPSSRSMPRRRSTAPSGQPETTFDSDAEQFTDERAREVITGRLIQGHIVDDDFPSPMLSSMANSVATLPGLPPPATAPADERADPMTQSFASAASSVPPPPETLGGTFDGAEMSEPEDDQLRNPELEHTVTLVGDVHGRTVIIVDDIMDRSASWIAAAETVVKRGGATQVYCIATHGLFGDGALDELEACDCIDHIVICNTFPMDAEREAGAKKLVVLDLAGMLAEAIRRNHYGESVSKLYQFYEDL